MDMKHYTPPVCVYVLVNESVCTLDFCIFILNWRVTLHIALVCPKNPSSLCREPAWDQRYIAVHSVSVNMHHVETDILIYFVYIIHVVAT